MIKSANDIFVKRQKIESLKAWEPFYDCVGILFDFQNSDIDDEHPEWRRNWIAGSALLRCIGHVLAKVDAKISGRHKVVITEKYLSWKSEPDSKEIFFGFIEKERNNILKTYTIGAGISRDQYGEFLSYGADHNALTLFRTAVYWWRSQLEEIEIKIASHSIVAAKPSP